MGLVGSGDTKWTQTDNNCGRTCAVDVRERVGDDPHLGVLRKLREREAEPLRGVHEGPRRRVDVEQAVLAGAGQMQGGGVEAVGRQHEWIDENVVDTRCEAHRPPTAAADKPPTAHS